MEKQSNLLKNIFKSKERARYRLAKLSFERKILILVSLQKIAASIPTLGKNRKKIVWMVK